MLHPVFLPLYASFLAVFIRVSLLSVRLCTVDNKSQHKTWQMDNLGKIYSLIYTLFICNMSAK